MFVVSHFKYQAGDICFFHTLTMIRINLSLRRIIIICAQNFNAYFNHSLNIVHRVGTYHCIYFSETNYAIKSKIVDDIVITCAMCWKLCEVLKTEGQRV